ncbi:MAG: hypothetical protein HZY79_09550 [Rhodoblastus sp.]|nr:MAG: hypothetical protein HZY79_09550 [Rhodoblastus sp.]
MPLALVVTPGGAPEGAFSLEADQGAGAAPLTAEESRYANAISDIFRLVAQREAAAQDGSEIGKQKAAAKIKRGRILVEKLTEDAKRALSSARSSPGAVEAASNAAVVAYGRYIEACDLVDRRPFEITLQRREDAGEAQIKELKITVVDAVDESAPQTSTTTNALFTAIGVASSVFDTVLTQELERRRRWWRRSSRVAASHAAAIALHGEFVEKLSGVAEIGLRGGRRSLARWRCAI